MEKIYYLPSEDINEEEATIFITSFKSGDYVKKSQIIYELETTKAVVEVEAEEEGYVFYNIESGHRVKVGSLVCVISSNHDFKMVSLQEESAEKVDEGTKEFRLTKKAKEIVEKYRIDIEGLDLKGIIREVDILKYVKHGIPIPKSHNKIIRLDDKVPFVQYLIADKNFKSLTSKEKIQKYRANGHSIGKNVEILDGALLIGNSIKILDNVIIGENTYIEVPDIVIGKNTTIGSNGSFVASQINIGPYTRIGNRVNMDISGGRYHDSRFLCGNGCLIADEVYINVCRQVKLGNHVALSPRSMVFTHSYWQNVLDGYAATFGPVAFGDDSWLGAASQVLPKISIGKGAIIMSASLVASNVNDFTLVGGVPASEMRRNIKKKLPEQKVSELLKKICKEFMNYLASDGFDIEVINDTEFNVVYNSKTRNIKLILQAKKLLGKPDIVILIKVDMDIIRKANEIFLIDKKSALGDLSQLGCTLIDFFRRRGILFYPKDKKLKELL